MSFSRFCLRYLCGHSKPASFVTTPIFYVNAAPHIGHLYSALIADAYTRYQNIKNDKRITYLSTGTDEHGIKIQKAANESGILLDKHCENLSNKYMKLFDQSDIRYTKFIRTSSTIHKTAVQHFWMKLNEYGHIYKGKYCGWYCSSDEAFLTEDLIRESENGQKVSVESGQPVEYLEEFNYMFTLKKFQSDILYWINQGNRIQPKKFEKNLLEYLEQPLTDISISRPKSRVFWGIPVPNDSTHTVYVWLDALISYLTATGYPETNFTKYWPPSLQVLGKDILKFHGILLPGFLIAAGIEPPKQLHVHSHWVVNGKKMSKSKNNVIDPNVISETYTMQGLRYFLLREGVTHSDGNFNHVKLERIVNSELADTLGNLLSRVCGKSLNPDQIVPQYHEHHLQNLIQLDSTSRLLESLLSLPETSSIYYEACNFYLVIKEVITTLHLANAFFEKSKPWTLKRCNQSENEELDTIIFLVMETLRIAGIILQPIIPKISEVLLSTLNVKSSERTWHHTKLVCLKVSKNNRSLCNFGTVLFKRINKIKL